MLRTGMKPDVIVRTSLDGDPDPGYRGNPWPKAGRQFAVMDAKGNYAAHTGPSATPWAGHKGGKFSTAQGNILAGEAVVAGMVDAFEKTQGHLSLRLMAALDAGLGFGPEHSVADREHARLHGAADLPAVGVVAKDGKGGRRMREVLGVECAQEQERRDCYGAANYRHGMSLPIHSTRIRSL